MAILQVDSGIFTGSTTPAQIATSGLTLSTDDFIWVLLHRNASGSNITDNNTDAFTREIFENGNGTNAFAIFNRIKVGSEPTNWEFNLGSDQSWGAIVKVFSGVDSSTFYDVSPSDANSNTGSSSTATATTLDTVTDDAMAISIAVSDTDQDKYNGINNSFTSRQNVGNRAAQAAIKEIATGGSAIGATEHTLTSSEDWYALHMALKAAAGGGGTTVPIFTNNYRHRRKACF